MIPGKPAPQCCGERGNEPTVENVVLAWTVYVNWHVRNFQQRHTVEMRQREESKLVHDLPVKVILCVNERDESFGVAGGTIIPLAIFFCEWVLYICSTSLRE